MTKKLLLITAAALLVAPAALADHRYESRRAPRVVDLAYELHDAAARLENTAIRRAGRPLRLDRNAMYALGDLERQAREFERTVRRTRSAYVLEREFSQLDRAFRIARHEMRTVHFPPLRRQFNDVVGLMNQVANHVDAAIYRDPRWRRHEHRRRPVPTGRTHGSVSVGGYDDDFHVRIDW